MQVPVLEAIMVALVALFLGVYYGRLFWRQCCEACNKERPHLEYYLCPKCKKRAEESERSANHAS